MYDISSGRLFDAGGSLAGVGYSGKSPHKNDPGATSLHNEGPIPPGLYTINQPVNTIMHGPYVLRLDPDPKNEMFGRFGFLIHGDSIQNPGGASEGCIILDRPIREEIWTSGDHALDVVATFDS